MVFIPQPGGRMTVRRAPEMPRERSPKQRAAAGRFGPVAEAWNALSIEEARRWARYGEGPGARPDGRRVQAYNAFTALGAKWLQMRAGEPIPRVAPTEGFLGDGIRVAASVSPEGERALRFAASGPNAEGVVTELLLQRLRSRLRTPVRDRYRASGFVAFASGALTADVPVEKGAWAAAIRFVRWDTAQETAVVELGVFEVG